MYCWLFYTEQNLQVWVTYVDDPWVRGPPWYLHYLWLAALRDGRSRRLTAAKIAFSQAPVTSCIQTEVQCIGRDLTNNPRIARRLDYTDL